MWSEQLLDMISVFLNLLRLCDPRCDLSWRMFRAHLRRKCNLLFLDGMSYKDQLNLSDLLCHLKLVFPLLIFILDDLSIGVSEVLKSSTIIVLLSISSFIAVSSCLMYWGAPMLGAYIFIIVISSCWTYLILIWSVMALVHDGNFLSERLILL